MFHCKICEATISENPLHVAEEMYGMGDIFDYYQCTSCGCLQLPTIPADLSKYYPGNYHNQKLVKPRRNIKALRRALKRKLILIHPEWMSKFFRVWLSSYELFWTYRRAGIKPKDKVLDVGCGYGEKLQELKTAGVTEAQGVDLFIDTDILDEDQVFVKKGSILDINETFDAIFFHHSLEHMPNQLEVMKKAWTLLRPQGRILIRIPTVSSTAFLEFKEKWYQLDAPRHLFLHSHTSFEKLAERSNLRIIDRWCDSTELQFLISEQYKNNISFTNPSNFSQNPKITMESKAAVSDAKRKAETANLQMSGDQICYVLKKIY